MNQMQIISAASVVLMFSLGLGRVEAQVGVPLPTSGNMASAAPSGPRVRDYSWILVEPPEQKVFAVNDIVTVLVDEKALMNVNSRFNRQKTGQIKAELKEFIRLTDELDLKNTASTSPTIDANLQGRLNGTGTLTESEGINYRIAATIVDVMPNGYLVLEAQKTIQTNEEFWEYSLSGICRPDDVLKDNTVLSENIADPQLNKRQRGRIFSSSKRSWGVKLYDWLSPF
jgi:flagellar L-ring protein precursor FlgH